MDLVQHSVFEGGSPPLMYSGIVGVPLDCMAFLLPSLLALFQRIVVFLLHTVRVPLKNRDFGLHDRPAVVGTSLGLTRIDSFAFVFLIGSDRQYAVSVNYLVDLPGSLHGHHF